MVLAASFTSCNCMNRSFLLSLALEWLVWLWSDPVNNMPPILFFARREVIAFALLGGHCCQTVCVLFQVCSVYVLSGVDLCVMDCGDACQCSQPSLVKAKLIRELILSDPDRKFNSEENVKKILKACQGCGSSVGFLSLFFFINLKVFEFSIYNLFHQQKVFFCLCVLYVKIRIQEFPCSTYRSHSISEDKCIEFANQRK